MLTTFDKAWIAGVVAFVCQYIVTKFFGIVVGDDVQGVLVQLLSSVIPAIAVWFWPNKKPEA